MTDKYAIDISVARPRAADIKASGYTDVIGYLSGGEMLNGLPKDMPTRYEDELLSADLGTGRVWERGGTDALRGAPGGKTDGETCLAQCQGKMPLTGVTGYPAGSPLWVNVGDFAATPDQIPLIIAYYNAFFAACPGYQQGGYATDYIIEQLAKAGCAGTWWQNAMDDQGVPGRIVVPQASMYQRVTPTRPAIPGGGYDEDVYGFGPQPPVFRTLKPVLAAPAAVATAEYKLTLAWAAVPGAQFYQYEVEQRHLLSWQPIVRDASTVALSVTVPVPSAGVYRWRMASAATPVADASPWTAWQQKAVW